MRALRRLRRLMAAPCSVFVFASGRRCDRGALDRQGPLERSPDGSGFWRPAPYRGGCDCPIRRSQSSSGDFLRFTRRSGAPPSCQSDCCGPRCCSFSIRPVRPFNPKPIAVNGGRVKRKDVWLCGHAAMRGQRLSLTLRLLLRARFVREPFSCVRIWRGRGRTGRRARGHRETRFNSA
jgi:hypothetical protein